MRLISACLKSIIFLGVSLLQPVVTQSQGRGSQKIERLNLLQANQSLILMLSIKREKEENYTDLITMRNLTYAANQKTSAFFELDKKFMTDDAHYQAILFSEENEILAKIIEERSEEFQSSGFIPKSIEAAQIFDGKIAVLNRTRDGEDPLINKKLSIAITWGDNESISKDLWALVDPDIENASFVMPPTDMTQVTIQRHDKVRLSNVSDKLKVELVFETVGPSDMAFRNYTAEQAKDPFIANILDNFFPLARWMLGLYSHEKELDYWNNLNHIGIVSHFQLYWDLVQSGILLFYTKKQVEGEVSKIVFILLAALSLWRFIKVKIIYRFFNPGNFWNIQEKPSLISRRPSIRWILMLVEIARIVHLLGSKKTSSLGSTGGIPLLLFTCCSSLRLLYSFSTGSKENNSRVSFRASLSHFLANWMDLSFLFPQYKAAWEATTLLYWTAFVLLKF